MSAAHSERIPALDGLRGVAILLVVIHHCVREVSDQSAIADRLITITESWHMGVDLFFVLSGYLITAILLRERSSTKYYAPFYWRRALRILPLYYFTLVLFVLLGTLDLEGAATPWYLLFASNLYIVLHGFTQSALLPLWSVAMEEQFYFVWPVITRHIRSQALPYFVLLLLASQPLLRYLMPLGFYTNPLTRLDGLFVGALIAILLPKIQNFLIKPVALRSLLFGSIGYLLCRTYFTELRYYSYIEFFIYFDFLIVSVCFGIVLVHTLTSRNSSIVTILRTPILMNLGVCSYSLYLFHSIVVDLITSAGIFPQFENMLLNSIAVLAWAIFVLGLCWIPARLSWIYVESRILRHKDRIPYGPLPAEAQVRLQPG